MYMCEDIPERLSKKMILWESAKAPWLVRAKEAYEYYFNDVDDTGTTLNAEQVERVKQTTNIPVSLNYQHPVLAQKHAILSQTKPSFKVISNSNNPEAKQIASVLDKAKHPVLYNSEAQTHNEEAIKEFLITGLAHTAFTDKEFVNAGEFDIAYEMLSVFNVVTDPNSRMKTGDDSEGWFYKKEFAEDLLKKLFQPIIDIINSYYGKNYTIDDFFNNGTLTVPKTTQLDAVGNLGKGLVVKFYDKAVAEMFFIKNPETGDIDRVFRENYFPEQFEVLLETSEVLKTEVNRFVRETTMLGSKVIEVKMKPVTHSTMRTWYYEWGGKPYRSYGMIHFTRGMQETLDKTIQMLLLNGILQNNAGWTAPKGSIAEADRAKWRIDGANPMAIKEYVPVIIDNQVLKPERDVVTPLSDFYPLIMEMMKSGIEYSTGINPLMQGDPRGMKIEVFSTLQQYQSSAMQRINVASMHINQCQEYMGKVLIQLLCANLKVGQYYSFFDEQGKFSEIQVTQELVQQLAMNNFTVLAIPSEGTQSYRMAMATELMKISQTTPDPQERNVYIKKAFSLSDIRGYDDMQEELNEVNKLNQVIAQQQEQLERDKELIKQFENQMYESERKKEIALIQLDVANQAIKSQIEIAVAESEAKLEIEIEKLKKQLRDVQKPKKEGE